ncbi:Hypothetical predicted protein [Mytilus galloprovincialis]|uniref:Uncharacterized protein n=1 Tax=Mytilus galloprovincialis TaxID=29158 RepID=A0A8B6E2S8_MYTGA|nr:Hypothetical predicted protein [Mytilus galloprovincialis]
MTQRQREEYVKQHLNELETPYVLVARDKVATFADINGKTRMVVKTNTSHNPLRFIHRFLTDCYCLLLHFEMSLMGAFCGSSGRPIELQPSRRCKAVQDIDFVVEKMDCVVGKKHYMFDSEEYTTVKILCYNTISPDTYISIIGRRLKTVLITDGQVLCQNFVTPPNTIVVLGKHVCPKSTSTVKSMIQPTTPFKSTSTVKSMIQPTTTFKSTSTVKSMIQPTTTFKSTMAASTTMAAY